MVMTDELRVLSEFYYTSGGVYWSLRPATLCCVLNVLLVIAGFIAKNEVEESVSESH